MQVTVRKLQSPWVCARVAALLCMATVPVLADPLIEYRATTMYSGPSGPTYGEVRQEFVDKVENGQAEVDKCGGCASAQAELDALLQEDQFQRMAGRDLTMTGQPPAARIINTRTTTTRTASTKVPGPTP